MLAHEGIKLELWTFSLAVLLIPAWGVGAAKAPRSKDAKEAPRLTEIPIKQVVIDDKFWSPRLEVNRTKTLDHVYQELEATGSIRNFDVAAKKVTGKFSQPWWADSDVYKWIEGASYVLATQPYPALEAKVDDLIARIAAAQEKDGYIDTHVQIEEPDLRWKDLAFFHELFCAGSLFEAGVAHYQATGKRSLLEVAIKSADYIDSTFGPGKMDGISGHEEVELALVRLYRATDEKRYLRLAEYFLNGRGQKPSVFEREYNRLPADRMVNWLGGQTMTVRFLDDHFFRAHPPAFDTSYSQDNLPVREQSAAVGHAVRAMYLYSGMADVAYETSDRGLVEALDRLYDNVTLRRMYVTGGIGPSAKNEGFTDDYDLPNDNAYQETCASAGMVLWNHRMFKLTGDGRYIDLLEQSLYNAVLAGVSLEGNTFCYATPLACDTAFKRQPWFEVPCCPTTVTRFFPSIGRYIYSQSEDGLWVNLYIGGQASTTLQDGSKVTVRQTTNYPWEGKVKLQVTPEKPEEFTLRLRVPGWAGAAAVTVNGEEVSLPASKGYVHIHRQWSGGDVVGLSFPLEIHRLEANPKVLQSRGQVALRRGPLIYCLEQIDQTAELDRIVLPTTAKLTDHFEPQLLGGVTVITGQARMRHSSNSWDQYLYRPVQPTHTEAVEIKAIPYCVWGNRGHQDMRVWIDSAGP
jgi:uncharacterized protein